MSVVICAQIVLWVLTTPLGLLVVPEVKSIMALLSGLIKGSTPGSSAITSLTDKSSISSDLQSSFRDS